MLGFVCPSDSMFLNKLLHVKNFKSRSFFNSESMRSCIFTNTLSLTLMCVLETFKTQNYHFLRTICENLVCNYFLRDGSTFCTTHPWNKALSLGLSSLPVDRIGSSSENMALYCVMISNRCTRLASIVLVMW